MSSINLDLTKIDEVAKGVEFTQTYSFKLSDEMKDAFVAVCNARQLSTGKVLREMIRQFITDDVNGE